MDKKHSFIKLRKQQKDWMLDHPVIKFILENLYAIIVSTISAFIFAFGFKMFMNPGTINGITYQTIVAGGASGISQVIVLICKVCGWTTINEALAISILYFVINIPIMVLAFIGIGRRFAIYTLINIAQVSMFTAILDPTQVEILAKIAEFVSENGLLLGRVLFAAVCTGLSSSLTFLIDASSGGVDVIAFYIGLKKKTLVGKYSLIVNIITLSCFTVLDCIYALQNSASSMNDSIATSVSKVFFSITYLVIVTLIIDAVNNKNQKIKVEVVTDNPDFGKELVVAMPHACTETNATGVFSGKTKYIFTMVVSRYELKDIIAFIKEIDSSAFVQVVPLDSILGRFHTKAIR